MTQGSGLGILPRVYKGEKGMQLTTNPTLDQRVKPQTEYTIYSYQYITEVGGDTEILRVYCLLSHRKQA